LIGLRNSELNSNKERIDYVLVNPFEQVFSDSSFSFRPHRSAHDAIRQVICLDLKAYFDTVNHDLRMKFISQYVLNPWLLKLVCRFLTSWVINVLGIQLTQVY
jgi:retron-type reverse transcriptase